MANIILYILPFTNSFFAPFLFFPFITLKALSARILIAILFLFGIKKIEFNFKEKIFLLVSLFIFSSFLSTIFSLEPYRSFWGNAERMEGFWSIFIYFLLFLALREVFKEDRNKIYPFLVSSIIFGIYACLGVIPVFLKNPKIRPDGIMGNAAYMGIVGMLTFFLSIFLLEFLKKLSKKSNFAEILGILGIIFGFVLIIISQTRSAFLGFLAGILVYGFLKFSKKYRILLLFFVLLLFLLLAILPPEKINLPIFSRISEILHGRITGSSLTRLIVWEMFLKAFLEKPFFGWGLEMSPFIFGKFINPELFKIEQAIFDRAHNKYVELLATQGIIGFLSYVLILFFGIYFALKNKFPSLVAVWVAYAINNFFIFDIQYTWLIFFTFCAWISSQNFKEGETNFNFEFKILRLTIFIVILIISILNFFQIRLVLKNLQKLDINFFFDSLSKTGPYGTELVIHGGSRLLNKEYTPTEVLKFYLILKDKYLSEPTDIRISSIFSNFAIYFYQYLSEEGIESIKERNFIREKLKEFFENFKYYPSAVSIKLLYLVNIEKNPEAARDYFIEISSTSSFFLSQGIVLSQALWSKGFIKESYEVLKFLEEKKYSFNEREKMFLERVKEYYEK